MNNTDEAKGTMSALKRIQSGMEGKEMHRVHILEQKETLPVTSSGLRASITWECASRNAGGKKISLWQRRNEHMVPNACGASQGLCRYLVVLPSFSAGDLKFAFS